MQDGEADRGESIGAGGLRAAKFRAEMSEMTSEFGFLTLVNAVMRTREVKSRQIQAPVSISSVKCC